MRLGGSGQPIKMAGLVGVIIALFPKALEVV
jgi:hypothetical protein